jgi:hypothetical protein
MKFASAEAGFAHRSQSAEGDGNPLRVPIIAAERVRFELTIQVFARITV